MQLPHSCPVLTPVCASATDNNGQSANGQPLRRHGFGGMIWAFVAVPKAAQSPSSQAPSPDPRGDLLDSWKEIAAYLNRSERTVRRWEASEGLPVHRHLHLKRGTVHAYKSKVDAWWKERGSQLEDKLESESRATNLKSRLTRRKWPLIAAASGVLGAALIAALAYDRPVKALTEKDEILLADFVNTTGDAVFDHTLKRALAIQLAQSPFVNVMPDSRMRQTWQLMQQKPDQPISGALAREACTRLGVKALLSGSIAPLGTSYVIAIDAAECQSGASIAREQVQAESKEKVLASLGKAVSSIRAQLGESLKSIASTDRPLPEVSTKSLEALRMYSLGQLQVEQKWDLDSAITYYRRAIELDPDFASAYGRIGTLMWNQGRSAEARPYHEKAFQLRHRLSQREMYYVTSWYHQSVTGELEKSIADLEAWKTAFPRDPAPRNNLALNYLFLGRPDKHLEHIQDTLRFVQSIQARGGLLQSYRYNGRLDEAQAMISADKNYVYDQESFLVAFLRGDQKSLEAQIAASRGTSQEGYFMQLESYRMIFYGRLRAGRKLSLRALEFASGPDLASHLATLGYSEALYGYEAQGRRTLARAKTLPGWDQPSFGWALASVGELNDAEAAASAIHRSFPLGTVQQNIDIPAVRAILALRRGEPHAALNALERSRQYEGIYPYINYFRGLAYIQAGEPTEALAEFRLVRARQSAAIGTNPIDPTQPLAILQMARAYRIAGDRDASLKTYEEFLTLWKDADPDLPVLQQAKREYASLVRAKTVRKS